MSGPRPFTWGRERIQLVYEGLTTAGPRNSYILHARNASALVADAQAQSPSPAHVVITVLHLEGNGTADPQLLDKVHTYLSDENIRPVGDRLTVQSAEVQQYRIDAVLHMAGVGSENEAILAEATRHPPPGGMDQPASASGRRSGALRH